MGEAGVDRWGRRRAGGWRDRGRSLLWTAATVAWATVVAAAWAPASSSGAQGAPPPMRGLSGGVLTSGRAVGSRAPQAGISLTPSTTKPHWACPESSCDAIVDPPPLRAKGSARLALPQGGPLLEGDGEKGGYDPQDLQSAYEIPMSGGAGQTIALVDAYGYKEAEKDLAKYRERYGLPPCTTADGCFRKVNQKGEEGNYPRVEEEGWETESALDMDMASAACPGCHIVLAEAANASGANLGEAVDTAARLGATEISNSYGSPEEVCWEEGNTCESEDADYDHPGVLITVSGGDSGYDHYFEGAESPDYPASLPYVVAVGGTSLHRAENARGWSEEVWFEPERPSGSGSGCSLFAKPSWQTDSGCAGRMTNDVAAVAACATPVSVYSTPDDGWVNVCGTSASSPLVAGIEAHASEYARSLPGADAFYRDPSALHDVTAGRDGECTPPAEHAYFCNAQVGYDGPTGNGTPAGPLELSGAAPSAATSPASAVTGSAATLNGELDPQGAETSYRFEYGLTTSYGTSVPVPEASAGSGTTAEGVSQALTGLQPEATYHYRLVASNATGTTYGQDRAFRTAAPVVSGVEADAGPMDGGGSVTISGANFAGVTAVDFGSSRATSFMVNSEASITAVVPPGRDTTVDVTVTTPVGTSATSPVDQFAYHLGGVLAWGREGGELGDGRHAKSELPVEVSGLPEVTALAAGSRHSLAVLQNGRVVAWGENEFGELGDGTNLKSNVPVPVCAVDTTECLHGPYLEEATAVAAGGFHSLALLKNGTVVAWGGDLDGTLGGSESSRVPRPVCVTAEALCNPEHYLKEVVAIAAGSFFSLALLRDGTVMAWGENAHGQLADGTTTGPETCPPANTPCSTVPVAVPSLEPATAIAAGSVHALARLRNGTLRSWGENIFGELGNGTDTSTSAPVAVCAAGEKAPCSGDLGEVEAISAGAYFSVALLQNGTVSTWGANFEGQLGDGSTTASDVPVALGGLSEVSTIASGDEAGDTLALRRGGELMSWGSGFSGSLGDGGTSASDTPVGVCAAAAAGPCPSGPDLNVGGEDAAMAAGDGFSVVSLTHEAAPAVATGAASSVGPTQATLNASVDPEGERVSDCRFEYGTAPSYGSSTPCSSPPGSGIGPVAVSATATALKPATTYYFRAVATNPDGTVDGAQHTFTTASPPEVGRCLKLTGGASGKYASASCTTASAGEDSGAYEWQPWPLVKNRFSSKGAAATFETVGKSAQTRKPTVVKCRETTAAGEYTGAQTVSLSLTLSGCSLASIFSLECKSDGATAGEIRTAALEGRLGWEKKKKKLVALDIFPVSRAGPIATFTCGADSLVLQGSVLAPISVDEMSETLSVDYTAKKGKQKVTHLEGEPSDVLSMSLSGGAFEQIGLTSALTQTNEEPLEIRAQT